MIVWLNGTHGAGKTTTSNHLQKLIPNSRIFDAEKVGETLMDVTPGLPATDNFQHWPPWRPLVVETAYQLLEYIGGTLIIPMTVLTEEYWIEINDGLTQRGLCIRHFVLHVDKEHLERRIDSDTVMGPSTFRYQHVSTYFEASHTWLHKLGTVIDATYDDPEMVAQKIAQKLI